MTVFRTAWRDHTRADREHTEDYDTEEQAMQRAEELARRGVTAFVYEIGVTE